MAKRKKGRAGATARVAPESEREVDSSVRVAVIERDGREEVDVDLEIEEWSKTKRAKYQVPPLSGQEKLLVQQINDTWTRKRALTELKEHLQVAIEIELSTIPIYLYTYYSIDRTPQTFPDDDLARFADRAGALIMSVAVEEMLHMSLACNLLFALGGDPQLYLRSPAPYPSNLPGHQKLGPDHQPLEIPLAKFSAEQLWRFLEIEYPTKTDAPPQGEAWTTIGQIYSYCRCIIESDHIRDEDLQKGKKELQIQSANYSPNNIDTAFAEGKFSTTCPVAPSQPGSAASVARFASRDDSHVGPHQLIQIGSREEALEAIATICFQGEGFDHEKFDDPSHRELSHYYKFLTLQSELAGYPGNPPNERLPKEPERPKAAKRQFSPEELSKVVFNFPDNPVAAQYREGQRDVARVANGLYQYMMILTESIFRQPPEDQTKYFKRSLHMSMIWVLDKLLQAMRTQPAGSSSSHPGDARLAATFENIDLGSRDQAFGNLVRMCRDLDARYGGENWYSNDIQSYIQMIPNLPDVSDCWKPAGDTEIKSKLAAKYQGVPKFPSSPPAEEALQHGEVRHACMGLNSCRHQGRTRDNACAGQGYCSTALAFNGANPSRPLVSDHQCHVTNACKGQGGCGLYGTAREQSLPGANECQQLGSCATPINAERFSTEGPNQGKSVWKRARKVFEKKQWPGLRASNPDLPAEPPAVPGNEKHPDLFAYGPTIEWIEDYSDQGMTACGSSGLSGAGSCS